MSTTIILDEQHYKTVVESAKSAGKTPEQFLHALLMRMHAPLMRFWTLRARDLMP